MTKIDIIHTPCKNCIFAKYHEKTQIDCVINKLSQFRNNGIEVLEAFDNDTEFFVINKKKCLSYRDNQWKSKNNILSLNDAETLVKTENKVKYIAVLYLEKETTISQLETILDCLNTQDIAPKGILIIKEKHIIYDNLSISDLTNTLNKLSLPWRIQNFIDQDMSYEQKIKAIINSAPINRFYFLIYPSKFKFDTNLLINIQNYIDNGKSFGCINIDNNLFFSYLTMAYVKNMMNDNLLLNKEMHTRYEEIC